MFDLTAKRALVTGASGGIGSAIARSLHAQGAFVVLSGTRDGALESLASELGSNAHVVPADLSSPEGAKNLADAAATAMGGIDILVNNAGLTRDNLAMRMKDEEWQAVLDVNLTAGFRIARACLRGMMKARWGRIIGITSVVGATGNAGQANYAASKAALIGMTKSIAREVASRGVTVNCIAPGFIVSKMTDKLSEDQQSKILKNIPMNRMGLPQDIASAALFLSSDAANYLTGQTLHVNGGMAMI